MHQYLYSLHIYIYTQSHFFRCTETKLNNPTSLAVIGKQTNSLIVIDSLWFLAFEGPCYFPLQPSQGTTKNTKFGTGSSRRFMRSKGVSKCKHLRILFYLWILDLFQQLAFQSVPSQTPCSNMKSTLGGNSNIFKSKSEITLCTFILDFPAPCAYSNDPAKTIIVRNASLS